MESWWPGGQGESVDVRPDQPLPWTQGRSFRDLLWKDKGYDPAARPDAGTVQGEQTCHA